MRRSTIHWLNSLVSFFFLVGTLLSWLPPFEGKSYTAQAAGLPASPPSGRGQLPIAGPPGVTVNAFNGNLFYSRVDLAISPGAYPFSVLQSKLSYNSFLGHEDRGFGYGWRFTYDTSYRVEANGDVTILWPDGKEVRFIVLGGGQLAVPPGTSDSLAQPKAGAYRLTTPGGTSYYFDSERHRRVTRIETKNGLALVFTYDVAGRLAAVRDDYDRTLSLAYDADNQVASLAKSFLGKSVALAYDDDGKLTGVTDENGQATSYGYVTQTAALPSYLLAGVNLPGGRSYQLTYQGRQVASISGSYGGWDFAYGENETRLYRTAGGQVQLTRYTFDGRGRVIRVEDAAGNVSLWEWDDRDNVVAATDPDGQRTTATYDVLGNTAIYTYTEGTSRLSAMDDPLGNVYEYGYDADGNLTSLRYPNGSVYAYSYDRPGLLISASGPLSDTTSYQYDAHGRLVTVGNALGGVRRFTYDASGNVRTVIDEAGKIITFTYDAPGRQTAATDPLGNSVTNEYDAKGNLVSVTDRAGNIRRYTYDEAGRQAASIDPRGAVQTIGRDEGGWPPTPTETFGAPRWTASAN